mmetsp:Transcript_27194/g.49148  ORF Transcript_27194/g.49148 Transcript_27194/m.49148 type:complete len:216 (-) Transcript_27194:63-710(-)
MSAASSTGPPRNVTVVFHDDDDKEEEEEEEVSLESEVDDTRNEEDKQQDSSNRDCPGDDHHHSNDDTNSGSRGSTTTSIASDDLQVPYAEHLLSDDDDDDDDYLDETLFDYDQKSNEPLRPGDVITYTLPIFTAGDARGQRVTTVLSTDPNRNPMLVLQNGDVLPPETTVKRIQVWEFGTLYPHRHGYFCPISRGICAHGFVSQATKTTENYKYK